MSKIFIVAKSEIMIMKRYPLNLVFNVIGSLFSIISLVCITTMFGGSSENAWLISGGLIWLFLSQSMWTIGLALRTEQQRGTLEQLMLTPSNLFIIMVGKSVITLLINFFTLVIGLILINVFLIQSVNYGLLILIALISVVAIYGFSYIISILVLKFKEVYAVMQVLVQLLIIFCGVSQPLTILPENIQVFGHLIIFERIIEVFRSVLLNRATLSMIINELICILIHGIVLIIIARVMYSIFRKRSLKNGDGLSVY